MIEVEEKLPITDSDMIKKKIQEIGFKEARFVEERDTYFDNANGEIRANGEALRVRETKYQSTGEIRAQINFKGKKLDAQTMTRKELETGVEDGEICRNILQAIGYSPAAPEVVKERQMLQKDGMTACLDHVYGLGDFLEIEILVDSETKREESLCQIEAILNRIGYQLSDTVRTSYLTVNSSKRGHMLRTNGALSPF